MRPTFLRTGLAIFWMLAMPAALALASPPVPVTTCGQSVPKRGVLTGDLDCSALSGPAVVLGKTGKLDLAGFTLTGNLTGVQCEVGTCQVRGPGIIRRVAYDPMLNFSDTGCGIRAFRSVRVRDVTFQNWNQGVRALDSVVVRNSTVEDGGWGVVGGPVTVLDSTITGSALAGVRAYEGTKDGVHYLFYACKVKGSTLSGNGVDIESYRRPVVRETSCTTSDQLTIPFGTPYGGGDEWGVCTP